MTVYNKRKHDDTRRCIDTRAPKKARYNERENEQPLPFPKNFEIGISNERRTSKILNRVSKTKKLTKQQPITLFVQTKSKPNTFKPFGGSESKITIPKPKNEKRKAIPKRIRELVWNTYVGRNIGTTKCFCCNDEDKLISQMDFEAGHIISHANGGKATVENLRPICRGCNASMGKKNMNDYMREHGHGSYAKN
jgi:hypothetical protein